MSENHITYPIRSLDMTRDIVILPNKEMALLFAAEHFCALAMQAIGERDVFTVALSGGSTPNGIYAHLSTPPFKDKIDWSKVLLFWSDERAVPPDDKESNFRASMEAGFNFLPIPEKNIFRMVAEHHIEENAHEYERRIVENVPSASFDLMMLGMGPDAHTASLFPNTHALTANHHLVVPNYVPSIDKWRMTLTYECINNSRNIVSYIFGKEKSEVLQKVISNPKDIVKLPFQGVGTPPNKVLLILDEAASKNLIYP